MSDTLDLLFDSMERNNMRLVCNDRKMAVTMLQGVYHFEVYSQKPMMRSPKFHYVGPDFYKAMLVLEGEDE